MSNQQEYEQARDKLFSDYSPIFTEKAFRRFIRDYKDNGTYKSKLQCSELKKIEDTLRALANLMNQYGIRKDAAHIPFPLPNKFKMLAEKPNTKPKLIVEEEDLPAVVAKDVLQPYKDISKVEALTHKLEEKKKQQQLQEKLAAEEYQRTMDEQFAKKLQEQYNKEETKDPELTNDEKEFKDLLQRFYSGVHFDTAIAMYRQNPKWAKNMYYNPELLQRGEGEEEYKVFTPPSLGVTIVDTTPSPPAYVLPMKSSIEQLLHKCFAYNEELYSTYCKLFKQEDIDIDSLQYMVTEEPTEFNTLVTKIGHRMKIKRALQEFGTSL
jgi:hypothetical protein